MYHRFSWLIVCSVGLVFGPSCSKQGVPARAPAPAPVTEQSPPANAPEQAEEVSPLVGKTAPDIEQKLLDGNEFSLKSLRGEQVVMLDFWATWCGPCVQEMPILAKVAE